MASNPSDAHALEKDEKNSVDRTGSIDHSGDPVELDGIHDGLEFPTEEERQTLRRVADKIPWNAYLIAFVELAERFSFYGSSVVFTNFIQQKLPEGSHSGAGFTNGQSGALGLGQRASTGLTTFYQFWCYITPLFGAYIADTYLGRFNTICIAVFIALIGHIILIVAAVPGVIEHSSAVGAFVVALIVMGLGTGLFKSNISPLVAEQYKRTRLFVITTKSGERVIVDPVLTISRVYMYFYLFINIGALVGQIGMTYSEKYVGFWLAYTLPTIIFLLCPIVLLIGRKRYVRSPPTGSILPTALRLWRFAAKGRWSLNPVKMHRQMTAPDFWENAKPSKQGDNKPKWMTFDDQWVDEVNRGLKACSVFCWYPIYWLTYNQLNNNLTSQAATMSTHGLPNDVLSNLDPFALIIFIPICDLLIYPWLRRVGVNFSALKKITAGFVTGAGAMIWAAVVQHYIYKTNPCHYSAATCADANGVPLVSPLNVWIQTGAYVLIAFSEIFASITGLEYAFTKAPVNMRSLVMAVFLFTSAISSALGEAFVSLSADPLLVWNYGVMAVLAGVTGVVFWLYVRKLDAQEDSLNNMKQGHVGTQTKDGTEAMQL
ncbi:peptide transporter PTR2A [Lyophyllum atratum]|nr:peptide transporter PTR2A [Lyophyllum atratum]